MNTKEMPVSVIRNGTVIDHIKSDNTLNVLKLLKLKNEQISVGINLYSSKMGKKGIIKIADKALDSEELQKITFIAPKSTLIIIKNYKIASKETLKTPKEFISVAKCANKSCITNYEPIKTHFNTISENPLKVKCKYCERTFQNNLEII